ncbi:hypothetical protein Egran_05758 [Elaphomyces granulatus]|uniref:Uncharacterized protein n=1 Tax=Elaphomyces granulatus TaxID=519963 RepID=A0A232LQR9_9EURO|nr:hypothetical protein Egran_05758 [Elaphomyces granulatus]
MTSIGIDFGLTHTEARLIFLGVICSEGQNKIDFDKMAVKGGYSSKASAYIQYRKAKRKLLEAHGEGNSNESVQPTLVSPMNIGSQTPGASLVGSPMGSVVTTPGTSSKRKGTLSTPKKKLEPASVTFYDYSSPTPIRASTLPQHQQAMLAPKLASLDVTMCTPPTNVNVFDSAPTPKKPRKPRANRISAPVFEPLHETKKRLREDAAQIDRPDIFLPNPAEGMDPNLAFDMPGGAFYDIVEDT